MLKDESSACFLKIYERLKKSGKIKSRADFAEKLGISAQTLNNISHGVQYATYEQIKKICADFPEVQPNDFFNFSYDASGNTQRPIDVLSIINEKDRQMSKLIALLEKR